VYTRCPQCQTVFRITTAQLKMRDGMVRCGRCQNVFRADETLVERPAKGETKTSGSTRKRSPRKTTAAGAGNRRLTSEVETHPAALLEPPLSETGAAPAETLDLKAAPIVVPLDAPKRPRTRAIYWLLGNLLLVLLLLAQGLVFYGPELARQAPVSQPAIDSLCRLLPCRRLPAIDMQRLDLVETQVTPHPRYDRALRIKATLVNRAETVQPYPQLEVSLIDNQGQLVARRTYRPREYLQKPEAIREGLPPQVAVNIQLDITSPGAQANGYEILLLPPAESE
jgi:predicted Zn finger-like uncharacterized protein